MGMNHDQDAFDVAVIGGGIAGLAAANAASRAGARTILLDGHGLGGRAKSADRGGLLLNEGPHALYNAGHAMRILRDLGIDLPGAAPLTPLRLRLGDDIHLGPFTATSLASTSLLSAREKVSFSTSYVKVLRADLAELAHVPFGEWLGRNVKSPKVRLVIEGIARVATYCNDTTTLSADAALGQLRMSGQGVRYLHGGWRALVSALMDVARASGCVFQDHCGAEALSREASEWTVSLRDREIRAGSVVLAAGGPANAARLLGVSEDVFGPAGAPVYASVLDLVLDRLPAQPVVFGMDHPLYLSAHCPPAKLGDGVLVSAMAYHSLDEDRSPDDMRAELRRHFDLANTPDQGVAAKVLDERYLHRSVVAHGRPTATTGGFGGRPNHVVRGMDAVFVAGDWVGPDGMIADAAVASGWVAGTAAAGVSASRRVGAAVPIVRAASEIRT